LLIYNNKDWDDYNAINVGDGDEDEDDDDDDEYEDEEEDDGETKVPLVVILGIFAGYLILGANVFNILEKTWNWGVYTSAYYSFISLSTIGNYNLLFIIIIYKI
jgi:hypothetical protein